MSNLNKNPQWFTFPGQKNDYVRTQQDIPTTKASYREVSPKLFEDREIERLKSQVAALEEEVNLLRNVIAELDEEYFADES